MGQKRNKKNLTRLQKKWAHDRMTQKVVTPVSKVEQISYNLMEISYEYAVKDDLHRLNIHTQDRWFQYDNRYRNNPVFKNTFMFYEVTNQISKNGLFHGINVPELITSDDVNRIMNNIEDFCGISIAELSNGHISVT